MAYGVRGCGILGNMGSKECGHMEVYGIWDVGHKKWRVHRVWDLAGVREGLGVCRF